MKLAITLSVTILLTLNSFAQTYLSQARPMDKKEWGYINEKSEFIIAPKYRKCYKFSEGYAPIYEGKKFFFIDGKGDVLKTELSDFRLKSAFGFGLLGFENGMVPVLVGKKWGYINIEGKTAIAPQYVKASKFNGGYAVVRKGEQIIIINKTGEETLVDEIIDLKHFSEGMAPFKTIDRKMGFINTKGEKAIPAKFVSVGYFVGGLAWAKTPDRKIGFINTKGEWVIDPKFTASKDFDLISGLAMVKLADKWVYTDKDGNYITMKADKINSFSHGLAKGKQGDKVGYFNNKGTWAIEPQFEAGRDFKNGFAAAKLNGKWGFINEKGEWTVEPTFGTVKDMEVLK